MGGDGGGERERERGRERERERERGREREREREAHLAADAQIAPPLLIMTTHADVCPLHKYAIVAIDPFQ
jgi:hypothetical protein